VYIWMQARIPKRKFCFRTAETCGKENIHHKEKSQMRKEKTLRLGALTILLASTLCAQDIAGNWQGTLKPSSREALAKKPASTRLAHSSRRFGLSLRSRERRAEAGRLRCTAPMSRSILYPSGP